MKKNPHLDFKYRQLGTWKWNGLSRDYENTRLLSFSKVLRDMIDDRKDFKQRIIYFEALVLIMKSRFEASKAEDDIYMIKAFHSFTINNTGLKGNLRDTLDKVYEHVLDRPVSHYRNICLGTIEWLQEVS